MENNPQNPFPPFHIRRDWIPVLVEKIEKGLSEKTWESSFLRAVRNSENYEVILVANTLKDLQGRGYGVTRLLEELQPIAKAHVEETLKIACSFRMRRLDWGALSDFIYEIRDLYNSVNDSDSPDIDHFDVQSLIEERITGK